MLTDDKRYLPRWQVKNRIVFRLDGQTIFHQAQSRDLSAAGVSLVSAFPLNLQQKLKLRIYLLEEDKSIEVEGRPVWVRETVEGYLAGVHFCDTTAEIQNQILQYAFEIKKSDVVNHWFEGWEKK
jgi:c-di-GMP-binding flagellar brake protein YcgR